MLFFLITLKKKKKKQHYKKHHLWLDHPGNRNINLIRWSGESVSWEKRDLLCCIVECCKPYTFLIFLTDYFVTVILSFRILQNTRDNWRLSLKKKVTAFTEFVYKFRSDALKTQHQQHRDAHEKQTHLHFKSLLGLPSLQRQIVLQ